MRRPPAPAIASATLLLNGQVVQQANAGQAGLRIKLSGTQFRADTEVSINGQVVVSHLQATPPASPDIFVELDENSAIRNSAGQLLVRARNTNPIASDLSNEISAGQLVGPVITRVKVKKKASGALLLNITGTGFPSTGTITVFANGSQLALQSTSFEPPDFAQAKLAPGTSPTPGTTLRIRLITPQGIQSNEVTATSK